MEEASVSPVFLAFLVRTFNDNPLICRSRVGILIISREQHGPMPPKASCHWVEMPCFSSASIFLLSRYFLFPGQSPGDATLTATCALY